MEKEKWIRDILQTSRRIQPVEANPFMATRVEAVLHKDGKLASPSRLPVRWVYLSALALALLITLNILSWQRPKQQQQAGLQSVMQEYGWTSQRFYSGDF